MRRARRLHEVAPFDISWHLTWANAWFGSLAGFVGPAFVFGPVGAGVGTPWGLIGTVGLRGAIAELARSAARMGSRYLNPVARAAIRSAAVILVQNPETVAWLPARHRDKAVVFPHVVLTERTTDTSPTASGSTRSPVRRTTAPVEGWRAGAAGHGRPTGASPDHLWPRPGRSAAAGPVRTARGRRPGRVPGLGGPRGPDDRHARRGVRVPLSQPARRRWLGRHRGTAPRACRWSASIVAGRPSWAGPAWLRSPEGHGSSSGARGPCRGGGPPGPSPVPTVPEARRRLIHLLAARGIIPPTDAPA